MRRVVSVSAIMCVALAVLAPVRAGAEPVLGPVVATLAGEVGSIVDGTAIEWRAVPYAAPPVGDLRWRAPAPPEAWVGVRLAADFAAQCVQRVSETQTEGSEDCLYLNVTAPLGTTASDRLPVMVHLHGGANFFGRSYRNADSFVERGVIVVTVGYRLGALGFVGHPELSEEGGGSSGEYGVLDQIAALHWVQDNIAGFGGDPNNVTLFGESSGSFDAVAIAASPLGEGLFARLAAQTETFWPLNGKGTIDDAEAMGLDLAAAVGCSEGPDVVGCLRAVPAEDLVLTAGFNNVWPWVGGRVLAKSPLDLIGADSTPVPLLVGSNREEAALDFVDDFLPGDPAPPQYWYRYTNWVGGPQNGSQLRNLYTVEEYDSAVWAIIAVATDAVYTCPMRRLALANHAPVWRYLYTHALDNSPDPVLTAARAAHFLDEPILWHDPSLLYWLDYRFSADEERLAARMAGYWTNFAKTGDPNGPGLEPWAAFTASAENIKVLDEPSGDLVGYHMTECAFLDQLPDVGGPPREYTPQRIAR